MSWQEFTDDWAPIDGEPRRLSFWWKKGQPDRIVPYGEPHDCPTQYEWPEEVYPDRVICLEAEMDRQVEVLKDCARSKDYEKLEETINLIDRIEKMLEED